MKTIVSLSLFLFPFFVYSQTAKPVTTDSVHKEVISLQNELTKLKKLKFSGWVQAQFQIADQRGIETYTGGSNFNANTDKRFSVRRGRLKAVYDNGLSLYNMQIDISERNVQMREFFVRFTDKWCKTFSLTTGMFNRPFGYEISYSSSLRESPERARISQSVFFNERDLGTWLTIQRPEGKKLHFLKLDLAMVSGTGIAHVNNMGAAVANSSNNTQNNTSGGNDFDFQKDFIGRLSAKKVSKNKKITVSGGLSYYNGGYRTGNKFIYSNGIDSLGVKGFTVDSTSTNNGSIVKREHYGADFQLMIESKAGITEFRAEYIAGTLPGLGFRTYNMVPYSQPIVPIYYRDFNGANINLSQRFGKGNKHQVIVKYDWYDPNINLKGKEITGLNGTTTADVRFDTWGFGYLYYYDDNVKISFYYDMVTNESTMISDTNPIKDFSKDIKDNVLTVRVQYKF